MREAGKFRRATPCAYAVPGDATGECTGSADVEQCQRRSRQGDTQFFTAVQQRWFGNFQLHSDLYGQRTGNANDDWQWLANHGKWLNGWGGVYLLGISNE